MDGNQLKNLTYNLPLQPITGESVCKCVTKNVFVYVCVLALDWKYHRLELIS